MKRIIILTSVVFLVLAIGYLIYLNLGFKVLSTKPTNNKKDVTIYDSIEINFNKDLASIDSQDFTISPYTEGDIEIKNGSFIFNPKGVLESDKDYTVELRAASKDGRKSQVNISFRVIYTDFKDLSEAEQQKGIDQTDRIEEDFPITRKLPYEKVNYAINYELGPNRELILKIETFAFIKDGRVEEYRQNTIKQRQEALDYIKSVGYNPEDYKIEYTPANLN